MDDLNKLSRQLTANHPNEEASTIEKITELANQRWVNIFSPLDPFLSAEFSRTNVCKSYFPLYRFELLKKKSSSMSSSSSLPVPHPSKWNIEADKFRRKLLELDARLAQIEGNSRLNQEDEIKLRHMRLAVVSEISRACFFMFYHTQGRER